MKRSHLQFCLSLVGLVALSVGLTATSCTVPQLERGDRIAADANAVGTALRGIAADPAVPTPVKEILGILGIAGAGAFGIWQKLRASKILERQADTDTTVRAIVDAIDQTEPGPAAVVKAKIEQLMKDREIFSTSNAIVDEHRSKLTS